MKAHKRTVFAALTSAGLVLSGAAGAAAAPAALTDGELDAITAGVAVQVITDAGATGNMTRGGTYGTAVVAGGPASDGQPNLESGAGLADGVAIAVGTNFGQPGPAPTRTTSVQTQGFADGNMQVSQTVNSTMQGPGGISMTVGWTYVFGMWTPL